MSGHTGTSNPPDIARRVVITLLSGSITGLSVRWVIRPFLGSTVAETSAPFLAFFLLSYLGAYRSPFADRPWGTRLRRALVDAALAGGLVNLLMWLMS